LQNEHFSFVFTNFDHLSQYKKVPSFRFGIFIFSLSFKQPYCSLQQSSDAKYEMNMNKEV